MFPFSEKVEYWIFFFFSQWDLSCPWLDRLVGTYIQDVPLFVTGICLQVHFLLSAVPEWVYTSYQTRNESPPSCHHRSLAKPTRDAMLSSWFFEMFDVIHDPPLMKVLPIESISSWRFQGAPSALCKKSSYAVLATWDEIMVHFLRWGAKSSCHTPAVSLLKFVYSFRPSSMTDGSLKKVLMNLCDIMST